MTRSRMIRVADALCRLMPSVVLHRVMNIEVIVLMYHVVSDETLPHVAHLYPYKGSAEFAADMSYLKANHPILSFQEFEIGTRRWRTSQPPVLLTFDDGFSECYEIVRPILLQMGIPCTFFVTSSFIDNKHLFYRHQVSLCIERINQIARMRQSLLRCLAQMSVLSGYELTSTEEFAQWIKGLKHADAHTIDSISEIVNVEPSQFLHERQPYLTSSQLRQLSADGFTLGAHGKQHVTLGELCDPDLVEGEIVESCNYVCRVTGRRSVPFAFPFTGRGVHRKFLQEVMSRNACVSQFFDSHGLTADIPRITNRVGADFPSTPGTNHSTLPTLLRRAIEREGCARFEAWVRTISQPVLQRG